MLHPRRLITGIVVFALVAVLLLAVCAFSPRLLAGLGGGLVLGLPLAWWGLSLTRFEIDGTGRRFYTPNTYIGVALTLLLAGRVLYRVGVLYFSDPAVAAAAPTFMQSPLTLLLIGVTAGYYIAYNAGVLRQQKSERP